MVQQVPVDKNARSDSKLIAGMHDVLTDLSYKRLAIVNAVVWHGQRSDRDSWVLVDTGIAGTAGWIISAVEERFGKTTPPAAIVLTHGHFDHVGTLETLAELWRVPIYAHGHELPYLNGEASYPPPDSNVGGGLMSTLSRFIPRDPINVSHWLHPLPTDGRVPEMPGWQWIHTPGHTPGHISLWRESDRTLIAGDAFITTAQESAYAVMTQRAELHGPPRYYTQNWEQAEDSVKRLAALEAEIVVTGHGPALQGAEMRASLHALADDFSRVAVPESGKYVAKPASAANGTAYLTPYR